MDRRVGTASHLEENAVQSPNRVPHAPAYATARGLAQPVRIRVSAGAGTGPTSLAAFDAALDAAGVFGFNLIRLSSVIPPYADVAVVPGSEQVQGTLGDVAYCVYAAAYASTPGDQAWAGVAWALDADRSGGGLFVEHAAASESAVHSDLDATLDAMSVVRGHRYARAGETVSSAVCVDHPVCAVVVATYGTAGWSELLNSEG